jgi:hypothetical protein
MGYKEISPFVTGDTEIIDRLNDMRDNDALRADGGTLADGDDHGHVIDEIHDEDDAVFDSNTWREVAFEKSFYGAPIPFVLMPDVQNAGKWCFQHPNAPAPLDGSYLLKFSTVSWTASASAVSVNY